MLVRLLYASRRVAPLDGSIENSILAQSLQHNPGHGITGILCFNDQLFLQVLEGSRDEVCELYNAIAADPRHTCVRILSYEEITERRFGGWTMGQVNVAKVNQSLLLKYGVRAELDPFGSSGSASMALLDELIATASVVSRPG